MTPLDYSRRVHWASGVLGVVALWGMAFTAVLSDPVRATGTVLVLFGALSVLWMGRPRDVPATPDQPTPVTVNVTGTDPDAVLPSLKSELLSRAYRLPPDPEAKRP